MGSIQYTEKLLQNYLLYYIAKKVIGSLPYNFQWAIKLNFLRKQQHTLFWHYPLQRSRDNIAAKQIDQPKPMTNECQGRRVTARACRCRLASDGGRRLWNGGAWLVHKCSLTTPVTMRRWRPVHCPVCIPTRPFVRHSSSKNLSTRLFTFFSTGSCLQLVNVVMHGYGKSRR